MTTQRFEIPPISLTKQKPTKVKDYYIELHEEYFEYVAIFRAEEPTNMEEPELGAWEEAVTNLILSGRRENVVGIERSWIEKANVWLTSMIVAGFGLDIKMYFKTEKEANAMYETIKKWIFKKD